MYLSSPCYKYTQKIKEAEYMEKWKTVRVKQELVDQVEKEVKVIDSNSMSSDNYNFITYYFKILDTKPSLFIKTRPKLLVTCKHTS